MLVRTMNIKLIIYQLIQVDSYIFTLFFADIIYIGTVNSEHFHQAKLALLHGKHVLCEKPVCINRAQVEELVAIAKDKDLFFMEVRNQLFYF